MKYGLLFVVLGVAAPVCANDLARDLALRDQADALERIADAQEIASATRQDNQGTRGESPAAIEGGAVPEGCQLKFLRTPEGAIATGRGPDAKRHAIYLLYCPSDH